MLLVVNCMVDDDKAISFDETIKPHISRAGVSYDTVRVTSLDPEADFSQYSHVLISGSEAAAYEDRPWNQRLEASLKRWVDAGKATLGICYGHQFMAKALAGPQSVRLADHPEMGWVRITLEPNPLFDNIHDLYATEIHGDEVINLPGEFSVIASSKRCPVQAFQYRALPVWGIQFHPEYGYEQSARIIKKRSETDTRVAGNRVNELQVVEDLKQSEQVLQNFLGRSW